MASTVDVPVIGKVDSRFVYVGGALVAGIVGYAWLTRSRSTGPVPEEVLGVSPVDETGGADLGYLGEGSGTTDTRAPGFGFGTNAEWSQFAIDFLGRFGVDQAAASLAIGKFLGRQPLDVDERNMVRRAIGIAGNPPVDGPWQLIEAAGPGASTPPPSTLVAPSPVTSDPMGSARAYVQWAAVPGASGYQLRRVNADGTGATAWQSMGLKLSYLATARVLRPTAFAYQVRAVAGSQFGPVATSDHVLVHP